LEQTSESHADQVRADKDEAQAAELRKLISKL